LIILTIDHHKFIIACLNRIRIEGTFVDWSQFFCKDAKTCRFCSFRASKFFLRVSVIIIILIIVKKVSFRYCCFKNCPFTWFTLNLFFIY